MSQHSAIGKHFLLGLVLVFSIVFADQYSKWLVLDMLRTTPPSANGFIQWFTTPDKIAFFVNERETFKTITLAPMLNLVVVWNQGISFGLFDSNSPGTAFVLIGISMAASVLMLIWMAMTAKKLVALPLALIIGGAVSNTLDRIRFGAVADFIDVHAGQWHWPAFNLADSSIVAGAALLLLESFMSERKNNAKNNN